MADCIFCRLAADPELETRYRDETAIAFEDLNPAAPVHLLVIPTEHVESIRELRDPALLSHLFDVARRVAGEAGLDPGGYRLVFNVGPDAGQSVLHAHLHVIGGRRLGWPPG